MFPSGVIRSYVQQDREIIRRVKPDLVIGDLRLSLPISARLERVPYTVLMNAYWSPYAERRQILPEVPITRLIPPGINEACASLYANSWVSSAVRRPRCHATMSFVVRSMAVNV